MTQSAPQFFDTERIPGYKLLKQLTFFEGGGGASVCLDDGCGGDVVDFLVMTRVGVSSSRCWMEWLCRVFRPAILHKATNVTRCSCKGLYRMNKHSATARAIENRDNDQLDAYLLYFTIRLLYSSTCFKHYMLIIRRLNCIDAASGIATLSQWPSGAYAPDGH